MGGYTKTFILMAGLMALFLIAGQLLGGAQGLIMAAIFGGVMNFVMFFFSDRMVLRMYRAQVVTASDAPDLYRMVDRLRQRAVRPAADQPDSCEPVRTSVQALIRAALERGAPDNISVIVLQLLPADDCR